MYYNKTVIVSVVLLFSFTRIHATECDQPILYQFNNSVGLCDVTCGAPYPQSSNTVHCRLKFPSHSVLTIVLEQAYWVTGIGIRNTDSASLTAYSFAYTALGAELAPVAIATLYNSSLPSGGLALIGRGEHQLIGFQRPIQPSSLSVFGYGAIGSESCVSVELLGCPPAALSYPINTPNLLQYRTPTPDNLNAESSGVEYGYLYGNRGVLNNGVEEVVSPECSNTECYKWISSHYPTGLPLSFSFYKPTSIKTIQLFHFTTTDIPIVSITVHSPGAVPPYLTATHSVSVLTFENPINTDYIQIVVNFNSTLTLTEVVLSDSAGNNVLELEVAITAVTSPDYLTALIATSSALLFLLLIAACAILVLSLMACRNYRELSKIASFYDTLTPESFAIYTSIKRSPKNREYVNVARMFNENVKRVQEGLPKSSQPLPRMPDFARSLKCTSESSSLDVGDYEKVEHVLSEHESTRNSNSARYCIPSGANKPGLVATLSNNLAFFNRNRCAIKSGDTSVDDVIIYDSTHASPSHSQSDSAVNPRTDMYSDYSITNNQGSVSIEDTLAGEHPPLSLSVSSNHLYKLAALRASPTQPKAKFQFTDESDFGPDISAEHLAGITLSQLNDSVSFDSV